MDTLDHYINQALEEEKMLHPPSLEPFEAYAQKFRIQVRESLINFKKSFLNGYKLLAPISTNDQALANIDSFDKILDVLAKGKLLYHLFGYTTDTLAELYRIAHEIVEKKHYQDGHDAYLFIVTIAPHIREAWLNFGYVLCKLGDYPNALAAFDNARDLDPSKADSYLAAAGVFLQLNDKASALKICDFGPDAVRNELEEAKKYIKGHNA